MVWVPGIRVRHPYRVVTPLTPIVSFSEVGVRRGDRWALRDVSVGIAPGLVTAVVGPSGAGKTTLLRLVNRLDVPTTGTVRFRGDDAATLGSPALRRRAGMVFQRPTPFGGTVRDNLLVALSGGRDDVLAETLRRVGLDASFLDRPAAELSGGEAQRMCLARTLVTEPELLLLDEPTSALDAGQRAVFERLVGELVADGLTALWVTHDLDQVRRVSKRVLVLVDGRLVHAGPTEGLSDRPEAMTLFTGDPAGSR